MSIEDLDDIAEELADKLGIYSEYRSYFVAKLKQRIRAAFEVEAMRLPGTNFAVSADGQLWVLMYDNERGLYWIHMPIKRGAATESTEGAK